VHLLSCAYGMSQCLGLQTGDGIEKARELGCPTTDDGQFFGQTQTAMRFGALRTRSLEGSVSTAYQDGMPCTFSPDSDAEELQNLKLTDILITMADGSTRSPTGATWNPASERNEMLTLLMLGHFGFGEGKAMKSITIKGSTYDGAGLSYTNMGHELAFAKWWTVEDHARLEKTGSWLQDRLLDPTDCADAFPDTTHLIQVVFNGGMRVTFNDRKKFPFDFDQRKHKQMFKIFFQDGSELPAEKFLGLADEADGDNYVDLCMKLTGDDVVKFRGVPGSDGGGAKIRLLSTRQCSFLVLPKGDCMNAFVGAECGDSSTKSQEICVTAVPGAQFSCDPTTSAGKYQFYNLTKEEISALTDCHYVTP